MTIRPGLALLLAMLEAATPLATARAQASAPPDSARAARALGRLFRPDGCGCGSTRWWSTTDRGAWEPVG